MRSRLLVPDRGGCGLSAPARRAATRVAVSSQTTGAGGYSWPAPTDALGGPTRVKVSSAGCRLD
jgi:hypothetical protein